MFERGMHMKGVKRLLLGCVFDRDSFPAQNFNAAMQLAENNNIAILNEL